MSADNLFYEPYNIALEDISEIWSFAQGILSKDYKPHYLPNVANLKNLVDEAKRSISNLENGILTLNLNP